MGQRGDLLRAQSASFQKLEALQKEEYLHTQGLILNGLKEIKYALYERTIHGSTKADIEALAKVNALIVQMEELEG